jgi:hypothetical protein
VNVPMPQKRQRFVAKGPNSDLADRHAPDTDCRARIVRDQPCVPLFDAPGTWEAGKRRSGTLTASPGLGEPAQSSMPSSEPGGGRLRSCWLRSIEPPHGGSSMRQAKKRSKRKRSRAALPVLGAAGVSLAMAGGASANAPAVEVPSQDSGPRILLAEEEIFDVSLATFHVFDRERDFGPRVRLAAGRCGGGCGGCHAGGGCGGCHAATMGTMGCAHGGPAGCAGHPGWGGCAGHGCRGCRGCGGCGCGVGLWIGGCAGCGGGCGSCLQWDPFLGWVYAC